MEPLLFLVHRIPYPPNKGDKIRSYHLLQHLARHYAVHLGAFIDDPEDWSHQDKVKALCASTCLLPLHPGRSKRTSLKGLWTGQALTLPYYYQAPLQQWVDAVIQREQIRRIVVFSSSMAQYAEKHPQAYRLMDFVDLDSDKWTQYAHSKSWPMNQLYRREGRRLLDYERHIAASFDASLFVSAHEAGVFCERAPLCASKVHWYNNGVDTHYFDPALSHLNPYPPAQIALVFTGAMDYWPNAEAVEWFGKTIFPPLRRLRPNLHFYIVGSNPTDSVRQLGRQEGIHVTGRVPDVRPYLAHAHWVVAPLRIARGIQNKILEALAMEKPVMASAQAMEGLDTQSLGPGCLTATTPEEWMTGAQPWIQGSPQRISSHRQWVMQHFDWTTNLKVVDDLLSSVQTGQTAP
ncbi:TIGR03087 family PEP-CTERM/XrtA system glycosyltransferase [Ferrovum sp.]|uniref:TIGR03087 family PEP-CTERM/XrtA system glycosyltransferase n=1 Tax=Ferrovum sp. TaxID=2609467 RepID=UPI0026108EAA|nr:TIGR03087 family PEP-CTERM/XrtA system glycosyltransferase [Ferrovum sp.]